MLTKQVGQNWDKIIGHNFFWIFKLGNGHLTIYTKFRNYEESILKLRIVSRNLISHYITIQKATLTPLVAGEMSQVTIKHNLPYLSVEDLAISPTNLAACSFT